jgi:hypothetical protein
VAKTLVTVGPVVLGKFAVLAVVLYRPLALRITVLGIWRNFTSIKSIHGSDLDTISDIWYCENLHYHAPSNLLFAASEEND